MAVYTHLGPEDVAPLLARYDAGDLVSLKGIAEGVQNSNFFVETTKSRFILTLYEERVDPADLPFFYAMLKHLHDAGCKVPRFITDQQGQWLQRVAGRPGCLIEFLQGVSVTRPTPAQARATAEALAQMHTALADFTETKPNRLGVADWLPLSERCTVAGLEDIQPGLSDRIFAECEFLEARWPRHLPVGAIHADLFPDNVLMFGSEVTGLIDFYFACTDIRAYDLAVTHTAWSFESGVFDPAVSKSILEGYSNSIDLDVPTRDAFPVLLRGACLRFLLTRCYDWINTPANALVTRKDPIAFLRRLDFYSDKDNVALLLGQLR